MTREELRDYVDEQQTLNNIPYHVYSALIDGIDTLEQEPTTKNDLGVDAVSRQEVLDLIADYDLSMGQVVKGIHALPSVTPQEPKTGYWVGIDEEPHEDYECSYCGYVVSTFTANIKPHTEYKFCPNCGCRMIELQESEDKG